MSETTKCKTCGTELPPGALPGQCPRCLFGLGLDAAHDPPPRRGRQQFAGYELVRQLGCGGMGVVYEALQTSLHRSIALKMILGVESCSPKTRRRFFIEAEAVARLDHPNIVPIYEVGEYEEQPFIAMKLIRGESLRDKMVHGEIGLAKNRDGKSATASAESQRAVARLVATLARAVHHTHQHDVVHRDIKPENVLFDADRVPYLTDFGLAKLLDPGQTSPSAPTEFLGTVIYMSPEQVRSERITPASDIYGLGATLYELLTGRVPFRGTSPNETFQAIETQPPPRLRQLNPAIDRDLETICLKCLEKSPGNRYGSGLELAEDLERWLHHQPIKARPAGLFLRASRWTRRNMMAAALILTLFAALITAIGLYVQIRERSRVERERNADISQDLSAQMQDLWRDPRRTSLLITAEKLALLRGLRVPDNATTASRLTFEVNIQENPFAQAMAYAPLLERLQTQMRGILGRPVLLDLKFCKFSQNAHREVATGQTDIQRLGAVAYLRARDISPGVRAVVGEDTGKETVIFVRRDSSITNLSGFRGHSFAFGDTNSTMNLWTKKHLVMAGVRATNLSFFTNFNEAARFGGAEELNSDQVMAASTNLPVIVSGAEAARQVLGGQFDGAVLQRCYFDQLRHKRAGLREVFSFNITPNVYVAREGLDPTITRAFTAAMLAINDPKVLGLLQRKPPLRRFQSVNEAEFEQLHRILDTEAVQFDGTAASSPPAPSGVSESNR